MYTDNRVITAKQGSEGIYKCYLKFYKTNATDSKMPPCGTVSYITMYMHITRFHKESKMKYSIS